jgi:hypothetical protein
MDDEAASQQLMSEARGTPHVNDMDGPGPAIPLRLDGAGAGDSQDSPSASLGPAKPKTKKSKRQQFAISQMPRTFRSSLPSLDELHAAAVGTPSKSQAYVPTAPPSQITGHSTKDTKRSQTAAGLDESYTQSSNTVEATSQSSQSNRKRRKKDKLRGQSSQNNAELETTRVSETPAATQEMALPTATDDDDRWNGATDEPALIPSDLREKVNLDKPQRSQSDERIPLQVIAHVDTTEVAPKHVRAKVHLPHASNTENATGGTSTGQNGSKKKKKRIGKDKQAAASSISDLTGLVRNAHDASTQPPFENNSSSAVPSREKKSLGKKRVRYSVGGITGKPRISKADPNKNYQRGDGNNDRTAADGALEEEHELGHPPDKRLGGDYTADEKELLRRAIRDYQERNGLDTADLVEIIHWTNRSKIKLVEHNDSAQGEALLQKDSDAFWDEIKSVGLLRDLRDVKRHVRSRYHLYRRGHWSQEEDEQLKELHNIYPGQWKLIATQLQRLEKDTYAHWRDYVQHGENRVIKRWTTDEEDKLVQVLSVVCQKIEDCRAEAGQPPLDDYYPMINWQEVCRRMDDTRSRLQCQSKWKIMCGRVPPPALDIEIKPRKTPAPDVTTMEPASSQKHSSQSTKKKDRKSLVSAGGLHSPGPEDMLWGDKYDLVEYLVMQRGERGLAWYDQIDWRDIASKMGPMWSVHTLQQAYGQLCELTLDGMTDDLDLALNSFITHIAAYHEHQENERYQPVQTIGLDGSDATHRNPDRKRKRKSDATSGKGSVKKQSKTPSSSAKVFKSEALITESDTEL